MAPGMQLLSPQLEIDSTKNQPPAFLPASSGKQCFDSLLPAAVRLHSSTGPLNDGFQALGPLGTVRDARREPSRDAKP